MLNDNWEEKNGINLPVHTNCPNGIQNSHMGNMMLQQFSQNDHIAESSNRTNLAPLTLPKSTSESSIPPQLNLQDLIKIISASCGPMKTPPEIGTPEYMKLVEILQQQSSVQPNGILGQLNDRNNQEKIIGNCLKNDSIVDVSKKDEKKPTFEKTARLCAEKLWEGSLQLSSSVTLSAVASFKSGEKLVGNSWPESIEVKGKVRLEAFEKYVQDLPRSRNRGLMVISISWNEGSSNKGLAGMKEVAKGYKKSSRVGFAQLLSGIDLYICPRSDPIITILAKYGFFKGVAVIDDKPDSMIGCVVWRKNRPVNPAGNTSDGKSSPDSSQNLNSPPGFSIKQVAEKKLSPEKIPPESSQHDELLTLPLTLPLTTISVEVDHNGGNSSSSLQNPVSYDSCNLGRKRNFEDDDLPEFDFGVASGKSTLVGQPINPAISGNNNSRLTQLSKNNVNVSLEQSTKKVKLFDDDDMPEWCPPNLHNQLPPQTTTTKFQTLPPPPPRPSLPPPPVAPPPRPPCIPPPPRADTRASFSYQPFRPANSSLPPTFVGPPPLPPLPPPPQLPPQQPQQPRQQLPPPPPPPQQPPRPPQHPPPFNSSGGFNSNQVLWHQHLPFLPSNGRRS